MANGNGNGNGVSVEEKVGYSSGGPKKPAGRYTGIDVIRGWPKETPLARGGASYRYYPDTQKTYKMSGESATEVRAGRPNGNGGTVGRQANPRGGS